MKRVVLLAAACALIAAPALAQSANQKSNARMQQQTTGAAPASDSMMTADFVRKAAISDMFEMQSSKLAQQKAKEADSKKFAAKMVTDHGKTSSELKSMVKSGKVKAEIPSALDAEHQAKLDQLKGLQGEEFTRAYDRMQQEGHQRAVSLFQSYSQIGDNPALKQWASKTLPHLQQHLDMAQKLPQ